MTLFEECLLALDGSTKLSNNETLEVYNLMAELFPITSWGRIDWEKVERKQRLQCSNILFKIEDVDLDAEVYIIWDEVTLPAVKTNLKKVLSVIDDVTAVSFDTWIFCHEDKYVIEFYHESDIQIGWKLQGSSAYRSID